MKKTFKTIDADSILQVLRKVAHETSGVVGYAIAKNMRMFDDALTEYTNIKNELIKKYGDQNDKGDWFIANGTLGYANFSREIKEYNDIEIDIDVMQITQQQLIDSGLMGDTMFVLDSFMVKAEEAKAE